MLNRTLAIAWKEILQLRRDRLTLAMMVAIPLVQLLIFGYAINTDVRHIPTVVFDQDRTAASRSLSARMRATAFYDILGEVRGYDEVERALRTGVAKAALVVPPRYGSSITSRRSTKVQLIVDGTDPQTVASATYTLASLIQADAAALVVARLGKGGQQLVGLETNIWYNPDLRTPVFIVPGLVGAIITITMVMFTAMAIVRERERGTLEQLIVSPIRNIELVVGKIVPFIAVGYLQTALILGVGRFVFSVPMQGSLLLLFALAFVFIAANLAVGLVFSTIAETQQQAMQMSFFFFLPNILLSGLMFPFEAMPKSMQWLATGLPLTHFLRIVRTITLKGGTLMDVLNQLLWLTGILLVLVVVASLRFKKKLG